MTAVAKILCQNPNNFSTQSPKTKITWKDFKNKRLEGSSGHWSFSFGNPDEIFKPLGKVQQKLTHKPEKHSIATIFSTKFFPSIYFPEHIDCSFGNVADQFLPYHWKRVWSKSKKNWKFVIFPRIFLPFFFF